MEAVIRHQKNYGSKIADAVAAREAADAKLGLVIDEFDDEAASNCDRYQVRADRLTVRVVASMLCTREAPGLPRRVLKAIASHTNEKTGNTPNLEGAILALELAHDALESALSLAQQLDRDGDDIDEAYEVPYAAWCIVKSVIAHIGCSAITFNVDAALETIVAAKRTLAQAA